jgi:hypothetical protein
MSIRTQCALPSDTTISIVAENLNRTTGEISCKLTPSKVLQVLSKEYSGKGSASLLSHLMFKYVNIKHLNPEARLNNI